MTDAPPFLAEPTALGPAGGATSRLPEQESSNLDSQIQRARGAELAPVEKVNEPAR